MAESIFDATDPSPGMLAWFEQVAVAVEVHIHFPNNDQTQEPYWGVWVSNAERTREWAGSQIAKCRNEDEARLVAHALKTLRDSMEQKRP